MGKCFSYVEKKNIDMILKRYPFIPSISNLLGVDKYGNINHGSFLFYILPHLYGRLLDNDPDRVLSISSIKIRKKTISLLRKACPSFLNGKQLVVEKKAPVPESRPLIFVSNHGFLEDAVSMSMMAEGVAYYMFGSIPQAFNTVMGLAAYLNGFILIDRKNRESKRASIEKAVRLLESGGNLIICPEGVWNKSSNLLTLKFWPGVIQMAKKSNALIIPIAQLLVDQEIHISRLPFFEVNEYSDDDNALEELQTIINTELMELMEKYAQVSRFDLLEGHSSVTEMYEAQLEKNTNACGKFYDYESETVSDFRDPKVLRPESIWAPIAQLKVTPCNAREVIYARKLVEQLKREDFQRRF